MNCGCERIAVTTVSRRAHLMKLIMASLVLTIQAAWAAPANEVPRYETLTRSIQLSTVRAHPFDLQATIRFVHIGSGQVRETPLYYVGDNTWQWRFTGTEEGVWKWQTRSEELGLNGLRGEVRVTAQPDANRRGFLFSRGNRYILPDHQGILHPFQLLVWMNYVDFVPDAELTPASVLWQWRDRQRFDAYLQNARAHGMETVFVSVGRPELWMDISKADPTPRLETFELLEQLIQRAHAEGMRIHLWMWQDGQRQGTPAELPGGINGEVDQRLQRYVAARLGPLPGWTLSYGFDLHEWVSPAQLDSWALNLQQHFGWPHLLAARGHRFEGIEHTIQSYDGFGRDVALSTSEFGPASYTEIVADMRSDLTHPHLYEERHTYLRPQHQLGMAGTRRLLWWTAMAGGMGEFIGYFHPDSGAHQGYPYPHPEQLRLFHDFWQQYNRLGFEVCSEVSNGYGLCHPERRIIYRPNARHIKLKRAGLEGPVELVAVDTVRGNIVEMGRYSQLPARVSVPSRSDWALVITPDLD